MDDLDRRILALWHRDTRQGARAIGERVGLSTAAVQRRLARLRTEGVITAEVAVVDPAAVGLPVTVVVGVDIDRESPREIDGFKQAMRRRPEVQQCYYVTGETDFVLVVVVESLAAYERFTREVLLAADNVRSFTSHAVLDAVKTGSALDLGSD